MADISSHSHNPGRRERWSREREWVGTAAAAARHHAGTTSRAAAHLVWSLREAIAVAGVVFAVATAVFWRAAQYVPYHIDEGDYIWTTRYFYYFYLVIRRGIYSGEWGDNTWTHTQPMLTRYLVGAWLWLRGIDIITLAPPWYGVPHWFLVEARQPSILVAAGVLSLLYVLGYLTQGSVAGLGATALVLGDPLLRENLVRVIPEPLLMFFVLLGLWLAIAGSRRGRSGQLPAGWAIATGVALGLALQAKLTGVFSFVSVGLWALGVVVIACRTHWGALRGVAREAWTAGRGWVLALVVGLAVFVGTNPHLYPNPVLHTEHLFAERSMTMSGQRGGHPEAATGNILDRFSYVLGGSLVVQLTSHDDPIPDTSPTATVEPVSDVGFVPFGVWHGLPIAAVLAPLGMARLLRRCRRKWSCELYLASEGVLVLTFVVYVVGIAIPIELQWYRYLVPTYILASVLAGVGLSVVLDELRRVGRLLLLRVRNPRRECAGDPALEAQSSTG